MITEHELKIASEYYNRVCSGQKTFEIRKNDRDYQVGDVLIMREYDPHGKEFIDHSSCIRAEIVYMTAAYQQDGYCVLGIKLMGENE